MLYSLNIQIENLEPSFPKSMPLRRQGAGI